MSYNPLGLPHPPNAAGRYYRFPNGTLATTTPTAVGTFRCAPAYIPAPITLTRIGAEITALGDVGSKLRVGIYADDGTNRPGALILDAGTIAGDSATVQEITISQALSPGWYFFGAVVQLVTVAFPTLRILSVPEELVAIDHVGIPTAGSVSHGFIMGGATGVLPATFTIAGGNSDISPAIFGKA